MLTPNASKEVTKREDENKFTDLYKERIIQKLPLINFNS